MTVCSGLTMPRLSATRRPYLSAHMSARFQDDTAEARSPDTVVDVNLPLVAGDAARLGVVHGVNTSREVELTSGLLVAGDTDDGALGAVLGDEAGRDTAAVGQLGLYSKPNRGTYLVERTMMAPAACSMAAATEEMARVSAVSVGRGARARIWSNKAG